MIPPEAAAKAVTTGKLKILWELFDTLSNEEIEDYDEKREQARNGITIKFPITWIWDGSCRIIRKPRQNAVFINGWHMTENEYEEEKSLRRRIMARAIMSCVMPPSTIKPRI